ncbi:hypothetical protein COCON_G00129590 [Conger conger]|uniref:Uncharacterized protein n=1 Tax=Conger conger TaxID=82655 RepID=A0A9Q1DDK9_CONCO|nr:hypothetical protein COCON_G00129590 [Conger conger]
MLIHLADGQGEGRTDGGKTHGGRGAGSADEERDGGMGVWCRGLTISGPQSVLFLHPGVSDPSLLCRHSVQQSSQDGCFTPAVQSAME